MGLKDLNTRKLIRGIAAIGVILGIAYLIMAFIAVFVEAGSFHAKYMLFGALILFPYSVAVAYVVSVAKEPWPSLSYITLGVLLLYFTPLLADGGLDVPRLVLALITLSGLLGSISSFLVGRMRTGAVKLSLYLVGLAMIGMAVNALAALIESSNIFMTGLGLILGFPIPLIYAVTANALPSTFKDKPDSFSGYLGVFLSILGGILVQANHVNAGLYAAVVSLFAYLFAAKFHHLYDYWRRVQDMPEGPAKAGLKYFIEGHVAVIVATAIVTFYSLGILLKCTTGCIIHEFALGFISLHVWIHGPMMVPVILGMKHKRRFNPWPFILLLAAMIIFPVSHPIALALYVISLMINIFIVI